MATELPFVVMATDSAVPSGVGEHMLTLARAIGRDYQVVLAFSPTQAGTAFLARADRGGIATQPIGSHEAFDTWLRQSTATLLHVHAGVGWEGHALTRAGLSAGRPVVRTEHLPYVLTDEAQKTEHRLHASMVDKTIFVSRSAADTYRDAGFSGFATATIWNGIEPLKPTLARAETRMMLGIPQTASFVLTVARFTPQKDHALLLAAVSAIQEAVRDVYFVLVGDGPDRADLEQAALENGLRGQVLFLGDREDVPDLMAAADLFVLPSRFEGLPLVLLEAMAIGLPIVATRIGGTSEAVGYDYPWLVEPGDRDGLAATITSALDDADKRREVAAHNRLRFERHFRAERMGGETIALYRSLGSQKARLA